MTEHDTPCDCPLSRTVHTLIVDIVREEIIRRMVEVQAPLSAPAPPVTPQTGPAEASSQRAVASEPKQRFNVQEAAAEVRMHHRTIQQACLLYERSSGTAGLKSFQPAGPRGKRFIEVRDLQRWIERKSPRRLN
ncbi:hypothetical protein [Amycolatopsis magusensis]|uniref:hypothetical protein n=1 Tax=Amycolatopsis magusensis TaxID=882444 RepID=UPI003C2D4B85